MYRTVQKIEQKMLNYGASVLRLCTSQRPAQVVDGPPNGAPGGGDNHTSLSIFLDILKLKPVSICQCVFWNDNASRSNNARSQKQAVLYMAMGYSLTWVLTWIPFYILFFVINNKATKIVFVILQPLQGLYNLIVYMSPKVRHARNTKRGKLPWRAIVKAWMTKGEEDRTIVGRRHSIIALMWQRFQKLWSRFVFTSSRRSSATLTSLKASIFGGTMMKQSQPTYIGRTDDNKWKTYREEYEGVNNTIASPSI